MEQNFWSRRKAGVQAEAKADKAALEAEITAQEQAALDAKTDEELLEELDLPDPDTLQMGDDFKAFMNKSVPDRLRRRALRTLWRSNPVLANVDMLVDYGEDFTDKALVVENMQTAYQVGKGMLKHVEEMARQAEERENPKSLEEPEDTSSDEDVLLAADEDDVPVAEADPLDTEPHLEEVHQDVGEAYASPTSRRMTFRFENQLEESVV